jgi:hypothetical protein
MKPRSHHTGTPIPPRFAVRQFLTESAEDLATLFAALHTVRAGIAVEHRTDELYRAAVRVANALRRCEPGVSRPMPPISTACPRAAGRYSRGLCTAHLCPAFMLIDATGAAPRGDCRMEGAQHE